jgi:hypothetical protein
MSEHYTVVESRLPPEGGARHLVEGPGGIIDVDEDRAGNLVAALRPGYVLDAESEAQVVARALDAVRALNSEVSDRTDVTDVLRER